MNKLYRLIAIGVIFTSSSVFAQEPTPTIERVENEEARLMEIQSLNPNDLKANYNLAAFYYNQAVERLQELTDQGVDIGSDQDPELTRFYSMALPPAQMAYEADHSNEKVLEMLSGIYFGLGDMVQHKRFKEELQTLRQNK